MPVLKAIGSAVIEVEPPAEGPRTGGSTVPRPERGLEPRQFPRCMVIKVEWPDQGRSEAVSSSHSMRPLPHSLTLLPLVMHCCPGALLVRSDRAAPTALRPWQKTAWAIPQFS